MIHTITLNPALDKTVVVPDLTVDAVNRITELRQDAGGKGINVSKVIAKLGGQSEAIAILAGGTGAWIKSALEEAGITVRSIEVEGETRTNLKVVDPIKHQNTDINEPGPIVTDHMLNELLEKLAREIPEGDIVVISGSVPKGVAEDTYAKWVTLMRMFGKKVFLDVDGVQLENALEHCPYFTKPNNHELAALLGRKLATTEDIAEAAKELNGRGVKKVVISMGGDGAIMATDEGIWHASPVKVPVGSTVGAGDSVVAALAYAEERGMSLEDTVRLSMATGAANVMQAGTQAAERELVDSLIDQVGIEEL